MFNISVPKVETKLAVDTSKFSTAVLDRLLEIGLTAHIRSSVNSAFAGDLDKAISEHFKPARDEHEAAEKAKKEANANYKVKPYKEDKKAIEAFKESYKSSVDPAAIANQRIVDLADGKIREARGSGGKSNALMSLVKSNIIAVLKSKGKKHREALAMVGDDPISFIDKTARKRAGDDEEAYKAELAKLNAQYVDPAKAMLAEPQEDTESDEGEISDANDLL